MLFTKAALALMAFAVPVAASGDKREPTKYVSLFESFRCLFLLLLFNIHIISTLCSHHSILSHDHVSHMCSLSLGNMQYAQLGEFGTFELEISADDGTMTWNSDLKNIDVLAEELGIEAGIPSLNYHLHQSWTLDENYATGGEACGAANLGGHYDPYFAVGICNSNDNGV